MCDTWQQVYRAIIDARKYSTLTLAGLVLRIEDAEQYREGGKRLCHIYTTEPPPPWEEGTKQCEGACLIGFLEATNRNWLNEQGQPATVDDVERWFEEALASLEPDRAIWVKLGNWWDDPANTEAARMVLAETRLIIEERLESAA